MAAKEIKAKLKSAKSAISEKKYEKSLEICEVRQQSMQYARL